MDGLNELSKWVSLMEQFEWLCEEKYWECASTITMWN